MVRTTALLSTTPFVPVFVQWFIRDPLFISPQRRHSRLTDPICISNNTRTREERFSSSLSLCSGVITSIDHLNFYYWSSPGWQHYNNERRCLRSAGDGVGRWRASLTAIKRCSGVLIKKLQATGGSRRTGSDITSCTTKFKKKNKKKKKCPWRRVPWTSSNDLVRSTSKELASWFALRGG